MKDGGFYILPDMNPKKVAVYPGLLASREVKNREASMGTALSPTTADYLATKFIKSAFYDISMSFFYLGLLCHYS
jgi:hypothetical protein